MHIVGHENLLDNMDADAINIFYINFKLFHEWINNEIDFKVWFMLYWIYVLLAYKDILRSTHPLSAAPHPSFLHSNQITFWDMTLSNWGKMKKYTWKKIII